MLTGSAGEFVPHGAELDNTLSLHPLHIAQANPKCSPIEVY